MKSRYEVLEGHALDKELKLEQLKQAAFNQINELDKKTLEYIIEEAYRVGHYVGHIRGEQHQSDLLEMYKERIRELEGELYA